MDDELVEIGNLERIAMNILLPVFSFFSVMDREGRGIEYHMTKVLALFALVLYLPGDTLGLRTYAQLAYYGLSEMVLAGLVGVVAVYRALGLYINGYHHRTPAMRASASLVSCLLFGALSYNAWIEYFTGSLQAPPATLAFYPAFVLAEFRAASRLRWERVYAAH
ncbi:hypothetical protein [Paracoccus yeei]|uniref:hypothetical protein n=1 Tax=Paracoccus yeei TaxID=147645 RepID=UPI003BF7FFA4